MLFICINRTAPPTLSFLPSLPLCDPLLLPWPASSCYSPAAAAAAATCLIKANVSQVILLNTDTTTTTTDTDTQLRSAIDTDTDTQLQILYSIFVCIKSEINSGCVLQLKRQLRRPRATKAKSQQPKRWPDRGGRREGNGGRGRLPAWRRMPANGRGVQLVVAVSAAVLLLLRGQFAHRRRALRGRHMQLR